MPSFSYARANVVIPRASEWKPARVMNCTQRVGLETLQEIQGWVRVRTGAGFGLFANRRLALFAFFGVQIPYGSFCDQGAGTARPLWLG